MNKFSLLTCAVLLGLLPLLSTAQDSDGKPNIVLIVADYMGYADIEPFGAKDIKTPSLNQLASQGVRFTNHYASAPVCIPSRASLMSGLYPSKALERMGEGQGRGLHTKNNHLLNQVKSQGYASALIGKWHLGDKKSFHPNDHGFDYFFGFNDWTLSYHNHLKSNGEPGLYRNKKLVNEEGYLTDLFTDEAIAFIDRNAESPFFLYLAYNAGLPPYQKPGLAQSQWNTGWEANEASREDYVAMVEQMDRGIGKVLERLKQHKLDKNTLVIFTYDHGGRHLVDSGPFFHGFATLWEGGIRVPLIFKWPDKIQARQSISTPTIAMDLTATMIRASGGEIINDDIEKKLDGENLLALMNNPKNFQTRSLFWQFGRMKAIRQGEWKFIIDGHSQLLFDLGSDVSEKNNQFNRRTMKANELKRMLEKWESQLEQ